MLKFFLPKQGKFQFSMGCCHSILHANVSSPELSESKIQELTASIINNRNISKKEEEGEGEEDQGGEKEGEEGEENEGEREKEEEEEVRLMEMKMSIGKNEDNKSNLSSFQNLKVGPDIFIRIKNERIFEQYTKGRVLGVGKTKIN